MSRVTNVILATSSSHTTGPIEEINAWLEDRDFGSLGKDLSCPEWTYCIGGNKYLQSSVYVGAFNHLPVRSFKDFVLGRTWGDPDKVQLFIREEEDWGDGRFDEYRVGRD